MKKFTICIIVLLVSSQTIFSQTKKIAHRSHSGADETFGLEANLDDFGDPWTPEMEAGMRKNRAKQDSIENAILQKKIKELREQERIAKDPLRKVILEKQQKKLLETERPKKIIDAPQCKPTTPEQLDSLQKTSFENRLPSEESQDGDLGKTVVSKVKMVKSEVSKSDGSDALFWLGLLLAIPAFLVFFRFYR